jgi:hypothetical protein
MCETNTQCIEMEQHAYEEFLNSFHQEKINASEHRSRYIQLKIAFIIAVLGLGSIGTQNFLFIPSMSVFNTSIILLITPVVAIGYDLYIYASDQSIKRKGAFVRQNPHLFSKCEAVWESFMIGKRSKYDHPAAFLFSSIATFAAFFLLLFSNTLPYYFLILWFIVTYGIIIYYFLKHKELIEKYDGLDSYKLSYRDY